MRIRLPPGPVGWLGALLVRALARTVRVAHIAEDPTFDFTNPHRPPAIWAFWHGRLLLAAISNLDSGAAIPISRHRDGEYVARMGVRIGAWPVRGSTRRGGAAALRQMVRLARERDVGITPDGPRGPREVVQPGVIHLARLAGRPIIASGIEADCAWQAPSWDRFTVPSPLARLAIVHAKPLFVPRQADDAQCEALRRRLQSEMRRVTLRARAVLAGTDPAVGFLSYRPRRTNR